MGECSAYSSLQAASKVKFAAWPTSWRPPGADRLLLGGPKVNSYTWLRAVYSTINIVLCIIIISFIIVTAYKVRFELTFKNVHMLVGSFVKVSNK